MMGTKARVFAPLCNRSLKELVPPDHFYRHLEAQLDLRLVRDLVRAAYKDGGRESEADTGPQGVRRMGNTQHHIAE